MRQKIVASIGCASANSNSFGLLSTCSTFAVKNCRIMELNFNSVETIPNLNASAAFQVDSGKVFKEDTDIVSVIVDDKLSYIP